MTDIIDVRADEGFEVDALESWATTQSEIPPGKPVVRQFSNGRANLTYLLTYPDGTDLVLRRPPLGPVAEGSHDMTREFRVLSRLWRSFPLAPRAVALCDDPAVIGSPFFVMSRLSGVVVKNEVPPAFGAGRDPAANRSLSTVVVDTLADLHSVDPEGAGLGDLGHPDGFLERQVAGWTRRWEAAKHGANQGADELALWLNSNLPMARPPTMIHNDWRLDNMALSPDDPGKCVAVYDWDMATRGDPMADLGTLMATWYERDEAPAALNPMPTGVEGWMARDEAVDRYSVRSGIDAEDFSWYLVFGTWKLGIILQQIYIRWLRGQTQDERFRQLGEGADRLFELALERRS